MLQSFITEHLEQIADLCRKHHVRRLAVFGSAVRDDFDPQSSDVDLLVEFEEIAVKGYADNFFSLMFSFDDLFARQVDLVTDRYVKNPYLRRAIDRDKVVVYAA